MSLVIDANVASDFINKGRNAMIILEEKERGKVIFVANKELLEELNKTCIKNLVVEWVRGGSMKIVCTDKVSISSGVILSNDLHIIKLLKASGAMVLFTNDKNLIKDAKNNNIVGKKRKIITKATSERACRELVRKFGK